MGAAERPSAPPDLQTMRERRRRRIVLGIGWVGAAIGAKFGYDIGSQISTPWLGYLMAANMGAITGIIVAVVFDRVMFPRRLPG